MTGGTKLIFLSIKYSKNAEMNNLLDNTFAKPDFFTKKDLRSYYMKSKLANPKVELRETVRLSKEMLQNFHVIVCNTVVNFPETELAVEYIHEEGHAFKCRFEENCTAKHHGIHGISMSVNGFENDDIVRRHAEMDYNVTFVLNNAKGNIVYDSHLGFNYSKILNRGSLKETMKAVFEEIDKVMHYRNESPRKENISHMFDSLFSDN
tara:strand:- start:33 stop:653 length:621 start_codon:yes stop_codon:yes gene_type:complete